MNEEKKTEIKVGLTVLIAFIIFIFVYGWAKNYDLTSDDITMKIKFNTAAGLEIGDLVSVNGVRKGLVNNIETKDNYALVEIKFNDKVNLKSDASFSIMMLDLMGGKKIEINSGISDLPIDYNKVQSGKFAGDISTAMATLRSLETDLIEVIEELKISLRNVNEVFGDENLAANFTSSISQVNLLTKNLNSLIIQNKTMINETVQNLGQITESTNSLLIENKNNISSVISKFDSTLSTSFQLISKLNTLSQEIIESENNLGKILYNESLINDLEVSLKQIKELTTIINEQLRSDGLKVKADIDLF